MSNCEIINGVITDKMRIDWLADVKNKIGNVMLPKHCVHDNIEGGLRAAIDAAMQLDKKEVGNE